MVAWATASGGPHWSTLGQEGYALRLPAVVDPAINRTRTPLATIDHRAGVTFVDGGPVGLPHGWTRTSRGDDRATFALALWDDVRTFERDACR